MFGQTRGVLETVVKPSVRLVPPAPRPKKPRQETEIVTREVVESRRSYDVATNKILRDRKSTRLNSSHTVIYTLSLHDALPISSCSEAQEAEAGDGDSNARGRGESQIL